MIFYLIPSFINLYTPCAEVSGGRGDDGGGVGGGNDLGGRLGEGAVQGLRPGRRIVRLGVIGVL